MNATESFEIAAAAFEKATGELPPGKNGCTHSHECIHDWDVWCAAVEYMKKARPSHVALIEEIEKMRAVIQKMKEIFLTVRGPLSLSIVMKTNLTRTDKEYLIDIIDTALKESEAP